MNDLKKSTKNPLQAVDINNNNKKNVTVELPNVTTTDQSNKTKKEKGNRDRANTAISLQDIKMSYCTHVGWDGTLILFSFLVLSGFSWYLVYVYTMYLERFDRQLVWIYMILGILYILTTIYLLVNWESIAKDYTERALTKRNSHRGVSPIMQFYRETFINGKYYLWKLYFIELLESFNQLNNLINVYLCSLPVGFSSGICIFLGIDSFIRGYEVMHDNTPERRDRQIKIDILVDTLCMIGPLLIMRFIFRVPISIDEIVLVTLFPALCLFSKLRSIFREIIRLLSFELVRKQQSIAAKRLARNRRSIYAVLETTEVAMKQQNAIPKNVRKGFAVYNIVYGIFMLIVAIVQLSIVGSKEMTNCQPLLLWTSCSVKTPFCANLFQPTCNCAVLNVRKHNWTILPDEIQEMNALKVLQVNHGILQHVPKAFDDTNFNKLVKVDLSYNLLSTLPTSLGSMKFTHLKLANNKLTNVPESIWKNNYIYHLELDNNNISKIHSSIQNAKSLTNLYLSNNSISEMPIELTTLNLYVLMLDGNRLIKISEKIGNIKTLSILNLHNNNNISTVPDSIGKMIKLRQLDLRNNAIEILPNDAILKLQKSLKYIYLYDNPICINGWLNANSDMRNMVDQSAELYDAGCQPQCSMYCQDKWLDSKICLRECNSKACKFNNGAC